MNPSSLIARYLFEQQEAAKQEKAKQIGNDEENQDASHKNEENRLD